jgi:hypothetical protein
MGVRRERYIGIALQHAADRGFSYLSAVEIEGYAVAAQQGFIVTATAAEISKDDIGTVLVIMNSLTFGGFAGEAFEVDVFIGG